MTTLLDKGCGTFSTDKWPMPILKQAIFYLPPYFVISYRSILSKGPFSSRVYFTMLNVNSHLVNRVYVSISRYTTLSMKTPCLPGNRPFLVSIFKFFLDPTLLMATYNWPWLKNCFFRYIPIFCKPCPWALLAVIPKHLRKGNCLRCIRKGKTDSVGQVGIRGTMILLPTWTPVATVASITWS